MIKGDAVRKVDTLKSVVLFVMLFFQVLYAGPLITKDKGVEGSVSEVYKTIGDVKLKMHIFYPEDHKPTDRRPAIVFFFGGGWKGGSVGQFGNQSRYLASRGMVAMCAEYRTQNRHKTTPFECVIDGKSAVRWARKNAERLGVDPKKIAAGGGSAGGHVAAAAGTLKGLEDKSDDLSVSSKPNALVLFNPVFDNGPEGYGYERVKDRYKEISPIHNISKGSPPTIIFLGSRDKHIPVATAERYKKLMEEKSSRCELRVYEGQKHGFFNLHKSSCEPKYFYLTVIETDQFLQSLGYLEGEPTLAVPKNNPS